MRRVVRMLVVVALATISWAIPASHAGAGSLSNAVSWMFSDSPYYTFVPEGAPVRNAPLGVWSLRGAKKGSSLEFQVEAIASFLPSATPISARIGFYSAPKRQMITGGVEFTWPGTGALTSTLVERATEGTATTAEVWEEADEEFGDVEGEYTTYGVDIRITPKGSYKKLLKDPLTAVGLDIWTATAGTGIQPSVRLSLGDLTGTKPGLLPQQGTGIADDGSPQPWITRPVLDDYAGWRVQAFPEADDPQHVTVEIGKYYKEASQVRLLVGNQFEPLPTGSTFPPYDLTLWGVTDKTAVHRFGDAFLSTDFGTVTISKRGKSAFDLEYSMTLHAGLAAVHVVVPAEEDAVLLATGYQARF